MIAARRHLALPGLAAGILYAALLQGGFHLNQAAWTAGMLGLAVIVSGARIATPAPVRWALVLLAAGLAASILVTGWSADAWHPLLTLTIAAFTSELAARAAHAGAGEAVIELVAFTAAVVALIGVVAVIFHLEPLAARADPWRLQSTLTYQNAAGALFAVAMPAALWLAPRRQPWFAIVPALLMAATVATWSRGGIAAAVLATIIVVVRAPRVRATFPATVASATVIVAGLIPAMIDATLAVPLGLFGVGAGCVLASASKNPRWRKLAWVVIVATPITAAVFLRNSSIADRFTITSQDRGRVWSQTLERVDERLWFGTGPGTYTLVAPRDGQVVMTRFVHNEYLQTLSETGVAGLATVVAAIALLVRAAWRSGRPVVLIAAGVAFLFQSGVDFIWRIPVLVAVMFALVAASMTVVTEGTER